MWCWHNARPSPLIQSGGIDIFQIMDEWGTISLTTIIWGTIISLTTIISLFNVNNIINNYNITDSIIRIIIPNRSISFQIRIDPTVVRLTTTNSALNNKNGLLKQDALLYLVWCSKGKFLEKPWFLGWEFKFSSSLSSQSQYWVIAWVMMLEMDERVAESKCFMRRMEV